MKFRRDFEKHKTKNEILIVILKFGDMEEQKKHMLKNGVEAHTLTVEEKRKGGSVTKLDRVKRFTDSLIAKSLTKEEVAKIDTALMMMTKRELDALLSDEDTPIIIQARARELRKAQTTFKATEALLDRSFGKPMQSVDMGIDKSIPVQVINDCLD